MTKKVNKLALGAMLLSVMMVLGFVESLVPISGIPGIKIGLSNSVLLLSLYWLGIPVSVQLMLMKVLLSAFLFGGVSAIPYSMAGGVLSLLVMILLIYVFKGFSPIGAGVAGAVMHNLGQILMAMIILQIPQLLYYLAILTVIAIFTGALTGTVAKLLMKHLPYEQKRILGQTQG